MDRYKQFLLPFFYVALVLGFSELIYLISDDTSNLSSAHIILDANEYHTPPELSILDQLWQRETIQPFNIVALIIFICAICHIFLTHQFHMLAEKIREKNQKSGLENKDTFKIEFLSFMGEIEVVFGIWVIPLMMAIAFFYDWNTAVRYVSGIDYTEPLFLIVIMTLASTKPIMHLVETIVHFIANLGGKTVKAWWLSILTFGPILGSLITEPAAMTISALLLGRQFYRYNPGNKLAYATLGLLFVNVSVGGVLTNFAAPPVLMVVKAWQWDTYFMLSTFGWKAITGILLSNFIYFWYFQKEFEEMQSTKIRDEEERPDQIKETIPFGISFIHIMFLAWVVVHLHYPVIFFGTFLLFLGFYQATRPYQDVLVLRTPIMVGFFLAGLMVHGNLQGWWVSSLLTDASSELLMVTSLILTAFNDNAEVTFLTTLIPNFDDAMKYAVVAGAVAGGGLTVIANAPNLAGQALLQRFFNTGISALYLFLGALIPTLVIITIFYLGRFV